MPGGCWPSQTAATVLYFTLLYFKPSGPQEPIPCFAFSGGNSPLLIGGTGAIILSWTKHLDPSISFG
jgi:hypothetical protein